MIIEMHSQFKTKLFFFFFFIITGDTGSNLVEWIRFLLGKDMQFPHLKVILPTAPIQPYTPLNGEVSTLFVIHLLYVFCTDINDIIVIVIGFWFNTLFISL